MKFGSRCLDRCEIVVARRGRVGLGFGCGRGALDDGDRNSISGGLVVREKKKTRKREELLSLREKSLQIKDLFS